MRSCFPTYELRARRVARGGARAARQRTGLWKPFAGGTDLMVLLEAGKLPHNAITSTSGDLRNCAESEATDTHMTLGALTTYTEVRASADLPKRVSDAVPGGK